MTEDDTFLALKRIPKNELILYIIKEHHRLYKVSRCWDENDLNAVLRKVGWTPQQYREYLKVGNV